MKLQADRIDGQNAIARHGPDGVIVNGVEYTRSVIVPWQGEVAPWPVSVFDDLQAGLDDDQRRRRLEGDGGDGDVELHLHLGERGGGEEGQGEEASHGG